MRKLRYIFEWNLGIQLLLMFYMPITFYTFVQIKYFDAKSSVSYFNLLGAVIFGLGYVIYTPIWFLKTMGQNNKKY